MKVRKDYQMGHDMLEDINWLATGYLRWLSKMTVLRYFPKYRSLQAALYVLIPWSLHTTVADLCKHQLANYSSWNSVLTFFTQSFEKLSLLKRRDNQFHPVIFLCKCELSRLYNLLYDSTANSSSYRLTSFGVLSKVLSKVINMLVTTFSHPLESLIFVQTWEATLKTLLIVR